MLVIVLWTCPLTKQLLMQKETSTVKLWTHTRTHTETIQIMKNSTRQIYKYIYQTKHCCVFSNWDPALLSYYCLAEFFTGTLRLPLICKQTSSLLPIGWQDMSPLPLIQSDSDKTLYPPPPSSSLPLQGEGEGGWRMAEEEGDDRSRWGRRSEWRERVNSHVTGPSCSVDGKREIQQPQKKGW